MKITLGITTFNRLHYLKKTIRSLSKSVDMKKINVRIYDDRSTEYDLTVLKKLFPFAADIIIRPQNLKADLNLYMMYKDFLQTEDDILVNADSDLIYRPGWLEFLLDNIERTDGVFSLYNSNRHPFLLYENDLCIKEHLGSAGTVFKREILELLIHKSDIDPSSSYDWKWSAFLQENNIRLFASYDSYIQHIGIIGQNCYGWIDDFDYGLNFIPVSLANQEILSEFIEELFIENSRLLKNLNNRLENILNSRSWKITKPLRKMNSVVKSLLTAGKRHH